MAPDVMILLGSKTDYPVAEKAIKVLNELGIPHECHVASAHRTPDYVHELVHHRGAKLFVGMAGMAAHLPGVIASMTTKPVIGVPCSGGVQYDSLLSIVQMPPGIPVATVGVDRGDNAAYLAAQILALADANLAKRLQDQRKKGAEKVRADDASIQPAGGAAGPGAPAPAKAPGNAKPKDEPMAPAGKVAPGATAHHGPEVA